MAATDVIVRFLADSTSVQKEVAKVQGTGTKIKTWAKGVGLAIGGAFAVKAISNFVDAAEEADSVSRGLAKVLKNAGDETGNWAKHAEDLASAMSRKTGIDDETIKKGQTILATFHNLSSETGQTSGAFDRATKAAVDLSKAGFGDVDSAAKALGKALEDPEKGIAALTKAGVQFTPVQKEQIKGFLDAGDTAGAMNIILGEVESQVGGTAEATATASDKMNVAWGETQEALGRALIPVLQTLAPLLESLAGVIERNAGWLVPLAIGITAVVIAVKLWIGAQAVLNGVLATFGVTEGVVLAPLALIALAILAVFAAVVVLYLKWNEVWDKIAHLPWYAQVGLAILILTNPILLLITIVTVLAVYWDTIWGKIGPIVKTAAGIVLAALGPIIDMLERIISAAERVHDALGKIGGSGADLQHAAEGFSGGGQRAIPRFPGFANGGIVTRPTLAWIGEAGPEAVIPLSRGGGGGITVNVTTTGLGADAPQIQSAVVAALQRYVGRNGPIPGIAS